MLEMREMWLSGAEVKRMEGTGVPSSIQINLGIDKVTENGSGSLMLDFTYMVDYKPAYAMVKVTGRANCYDNPENIKRILAEFKKKKALPPELASNAINMINANAGINIVFLVRPFNLAPPFMPPPIFAEGKKQ